jgi:hypothetical protein
MTTSTDSVSRADGAASAAAGNDPAASARAAIADTTDPHTGILDTDRLGGWVADAARQDFATAAQAHEAIENELVAQGRLDDLAAFNAAVVDAATNAVPGPAGLWGAGIGLQQAGTQLLVDNPILAKQWESTTSAWTGRGGFTAGLQQLLENHGIEVSPQINAVPPGSVGPNAGVPSAVANNTNGALARDAIADRWRAAGLDVATEVPANGGARRVDVVVNVPNADPRLAQRIEIESKVGRTGLDGDVRAQAALDGQALAANRSVRGAGELLEGVGRVARPVGLVMDVIEVGQAFRADGHQVGAHTARAATGVAGGALGGWGGAAAGAAIGTAILPGVGTVIGGIVGGIGGALAGDAAGRGLFDTVRSWF